MSIDQVGRSETTAAPSRRGIELRRAPSVAVGGLPTVSLLPRELRAAARDRTIRKALVGGVLVALVVAGGSTAGAAAIAGAAQSRLDQANARTQVLVTQLGKFRDVQVLQQRIEVGQAAVDVASSTEIDWQQQLGDITADMPAGFAVTSVQADSASVIEDFGQGSSPLDQPRAATLQLSLTATDISGLAHWLTLLRGIPGYATATASVLSGDGDGYTVQLAIDLSPKALVAAKEASK